MFGNIENANKIVKEFSGKGRRTGNKEFVDCGRIVGLYNDGSGICVPSTRVVIIYSKTGEHVYPARPKED